MGAEVTGVAGELCYLAVWEGHYIAKLDAKNRSRRSIMVAKSRPLTPVAVQLGNLCTTNKHKVASIML